MEPDEVAQTDRANILMHLVVQLPCMETDNANVNLQKVVSDVARVVRVIVYMYVFLSRRLHMNATP